MPDTVQRESIDRLERPDQFVQPDQPKQPEKRKQPKQPLHFQLICTQHLRTQPGLLT